MDFKKLFSPKRQKKIDETNAVDFYTRLGDSYIGRKRCEYKTSTNEKTLREILNHLPETRRKEICEYIGQGRLLAATSRVREYIREEYPCPKPSTLEDDICDYLVPLRLKAITTTPREEGHESDYTIECLKNEITHLMSELIDLNLFYSQPRENRGSSDRKLIAFPSRKEGILRPVGKLIVDYGYIIDKQGLREGEEALLNILTAYLGSER